MLGLIKNAILWIDALAYHMTMTGGVGGGVNVGGGDSGGGWVVGVVMLNTVEMVAVGSVVGVLYLVYTWWLWQRLCWWLCWWL